MIKPRATTVAIVSRPGPLMLKLLAKEGPQGAPLCLPERSNKAAQDNKFLTDELVREEF